MQALDLRAPKPSLCGVSLLAGPWRKSPDASRIHGQDMLPLHPIMNTLQ